jgi:hypothetical protein
MSAAVICQGCGQPVPVPEDYRRNKIQCPACGVICLVPAGARSDAPKKPAAPEPEPSYDEAFKDEPALEESAAEDTAPSPAARTEEPAVRPKRPAAPKEMLFPCRRCGRMVRRQRECPVCDAPEPLIPGLPNLSLDDGPPDEDDDPSPYKVEGGDLPVCPACRKLLDAGAVVCVSCGYHLRKRKKLVKQYQPIHRRWETNYPLRPRLALFLVLWSLTLATHVIGLSLTGGPSGYLASLFVFTAMASFVLGTYDTIELSRDRKGHVTLIKTWRAFFFPLLPERLYITGHSAIVTGRNSESGFWEWFVLLCLLPSVIPAFLWWYVAIHKIMFHAALARDHGYPAVMVYKGWSEEQMNDIAQTLATATSLPWDRG